jgi:hypothetical protein
MYGILAAAGALRRMLVLNHFSYCVLQKACYSVPAVTASVKELVTRTETTHSDL